MMKANKTFKVTATCQRCSHEQNLLVGADDEFEATATTSRAICRTCGPPRWEIKKIEEMNNQNCHEPPGAANARWN